jgi:hypothetical protein
MPPVLGHCIFAVEFTLEMLRPPFYESAIKHLQQLSIFVLLKQEIEYP